VFVVQLSLHVVMQKQNFLHTHTPSHTHTQCNSHSHDIIPIPVPFLLVAFWSFVLCYQLILYRRKLQSYLFTAFSM